jgi:hypothetical protein
VEGLRCLNELVEHLASPSDCWYENLSGACADWGSAGGSTRLVEVCRGVTTSSGETASSEGGMRWAEADGTGHAEQCGRRYGEEQPRSHDKVRGYTTARPLQSSRSGEVPDFIVW